MDDLDGAIDRNVRHDRDHALESRSDRRCTRIDHAFVADATWRVGIWWRPVTARSRSPPPRGDVCGLDESGHLGVLPGTPLLVVRSGRDRTPGLNAALDPFISRAIAENRPLTAVNYPEAPHAFELHLDRPETRRILQQGLDFLRAHLV